MTHVMGDVFPEEFDQLRSLLPTEERKGNVPAALNRRLMSVDADLCDRAALAWCACEDRLGTLTGPVEAHPRSLEPRLRLGFADDAIVGRLDRLDGIPAFLLRGRSDIASPLRSARQVGHVAHLT